jgi:hypothetical protein
MRMGLLLMLVIPAVMLLTALAPAADMAKNPAACPTLDSGVVSDIWGACSAADEFSQDVGYLSFVGFVRHEYFVKTGDWVGRCPISCAIDELKK